MKASHCAKALPPPSVGLAGRLSRRTRAKLKDTCGFLMRGLAALVRFSGEVWGEPASIQRRVSGTISPAISAAP